MALGALIGSSVMAQVSVTFQVDMNGQTVSPNGVHVAGDWQAAAGFPGNWQPGTAQLTDGNSDGIYTLTVDIAPGDYRFKYINGNAWGTDENVPQAARINNDRGFAITDWHGSNPIDPQSGDPYLPNGFVLPAVQFAGAAPVGKVALKLLINMANETVHPTGVHVAGNLITPNWTPAYGTVSLVSGNDYAYVTYVDPNASYQYKFINGDDWNLPNENVGDACGVSGNRLLNVAAANIITPAYCYNGCDVCSQPNVTFIVDLTSAGNVNSDGAYLAGNFNGFNGVAMVDQGNNVFQLALTLDPGTYDFKFQNGFDGWEGAINGDCAVPGGGNRLLVVENADPITYGPYCFGSCQIGDCLPPPPAADITFQVDMNDETISPAGVFMIGGFTNPAWQGGATPMTDTDADGIYSATIASVSGPALIEYKYVNGLVANSANEEFYQFPNQLACNAPNGQTDSLGNPTGWNRNHIRSGISEMLPVVPFSACGPLSVSDIQLGKVTVFPNPTADVAYIEIENPNRHNLRMSIVDITGKTVRENILVNSSRVEINTSNLNAGLYFLNVTNERSERAVYKLMVQ